MSRYVILHLHFRTADMKNRFSLLSALFVREKKKKGRGSLHEVNPKRTFSHFCRHCSPNFKEISELLEFVIALFALSKITFMDVFNVFG